MRPFLRWLAVLALSSTLACPAHVVSADEGSKSGETKTVHVKGYTKKDGTYVAPHDRKAPEKHSTKEAPSSTPRSSPSHADTAHRDANGRIDRDEAAKRHFMRDTGYPTGRPGYVVDHIKLLACGGADAPSNMQWQTIEAAKAKDRIERLGC
jgi:hypothetical protein